MWDVIVLAGGRASRLDGADKPQLELAGRPMLHHVLAATTRASRTIVVGPKQPVTRSVQWALERPRQAGPVAAVAAGLEFVRADTVMLLAADLPWIAPAVGELLRGTPDAGAAVLVTDGVRNHLAACWRTAALRVALDSAGPHPAATTDSLYAAATVVEVPDEGAWGQDVDTWEDLERALDRPVG